MTSKNKKIKKIAESHTIEAQSIAHHEEMAEEFYVPFLDAESTLSEAYIRSLKNEFEKSGS